MIAHPVNVYKCTDSQMVQNQRKKRKEEKKWVCANSIIREAEKNQLLFNGPWMIT